MQHKKKHTTWVLSASSFAMSSVASSFTAVSTAALFTPGGAVSTSPTLCAFAALCPQFSSRKQHIHTHALPCTHTYRHTNLHTHTHMHTQLHNRKNVHKRERRWPPHSCRCAQFLVLSLGRCNLPVVCCFFLCGYFLRRASMHADARANRQTDRQTNRETERRRSPPLVFASR